MMLTPDEIDISKAKAIRALSALGDMRFMKLTRAFKPRAIIIKANDER